MLKTIKRVRNRKKSIINLLTNNKQYFLSGKYVFNENMDYMAKKDSKVIDSAKTLFSDKFYDKSDCFNLKKTLKNIIYKLQLPKKVKVRNSIFKGTVMLPTFNNKSVKIFDFENKLILNKFLNISDYSKTIDNYNYFSSFFNTPRILEINKKNKVIIEEMIEYKTSNNLNNNELEFVIKNVFENYIKYFNQKEMQIKQLKINRLINTGINKEIDKIINLDSVSNEYILVKCHGDLLSKNILFSNNKIYYIDFELANYQYFLYDIFTLIYYLYYTYDNKLYINNYFSGKYDEYFVSLFKSVNLEFMECNKKKYLHIFFLERYIHESTEGTFNQNEFIKKYLEIVEEF